jgi:hypothetical protein
VRAGWQALTGTAAILLAAPVAGQTPRELVFQSAFGEQSQPIALDRVRRALSLATAAAERNPRDEEAAVMAAAAQGYVAKLTGSRSEALKTRRLFDAAVGRFPDNAEAQLGLGAWHLSVVNRAGRLIGGVLGAQRGRGLAAMERAVTLGAGRAFVSGVAGMMMLEADPNDKRGRAWVETAARAPAPTGQDRSIRQSAGRVAALLQAGDTAAAQALAARALPFGWYRPKK